MARVMEILLRLIAAATVVSGAVQMLRPGFVLALVGGGATPTALHFFGIIGMFMVLFGALMWTGLTAAGARAPLVIAGLQKFGAAAAVGLAIAKGLFSGVAWLVAGLDAASGVLIVVYLIVSRQGR